MQGLQFTRYGETDPREATEDEWTGPPNQPQLVFPGRMTYGRWAVVTLWKDCASFRFSSFKGPQDPGAMAKMPGEMVYVARELATARLPDRTDPIVVIIIQFILDMGLFRVQLTWQYLWRLIDPNETPSLPHPLVMVVGVALTRGTTLWATMIQKAQQRNVIYVLNR